MSRPKTHDQNSAVHRRSTRIGINDVLRFVLELFAIFTLGYWGYLAWPFPWPALAFMIGTPLFAIIVWGLFRSPKAVIPLDIVGRGIVEIGVMGSAVIAWAMLGHPVVAIVFGLIALVSGIINIRKEAAREESDTREELGTPEESDTQEELGTPEEPDTPEESGI